jgi:hypothetical protein
MVPRIWSKDSAPPPIILIIVKKIRAKTCHPKQKQEVKMKPQNKIDFFEFKDLAEQEAQIKKQYRGALQKLRQDRLHARSFIKKIEHKKQRQSIYRLLSWYRKLKAQRISYFNAYIANSCVPSNNQYRSMA